MLANVFHVIGIISLSYPILTKMGQEANRTPERIDNISNNALLIFQEHYRNDTITKDEIFDYIYGILHAPNYSESFKYDLPRSLPHIPFAPDFYAFAEAGRSLALLHLNYETCKQYPGIQVAPRNRTLFTPEKVSPEHLLLQAKAMRFSNNSKKDTLIINDHAIITGIPSEAHQYVVNDRTPLEWFINRYKISLPGKRNKVLNDPNDWFGNPYELIEAISRIIHVSVESAKIIKNLPSDIIGYRKQFDEC